MRFFAFLCVFLFHALPNPNMAAHTGGARTLATLEAAVKLSGESGVSLFFLLSAYLIAELLRREKEVSGSIHLGLFYMRRALRIWPLYYLAVGLGWALSLHTPEYRLTRGDLLTYIFFVKNWDIALRGWNWNPIYILWTVSSEEQFYLLWPWTQRLLDRGRLLRFCGVAFIALWMTALWPGGVGSRYGATELIVLLGYFPLGAGLALYWKGTLRTRSAAVCGAMFLFGLGCWFGESYMMMTGSGGGALATALYSRFAILLGTVALFLAFLNSRAEWWPKPVIYLGKITYGLYVFHVIWLQMVERHLGRLGIFGSHGGKAYQAASIVLAFGATVATATLSYELFEKRFLRLKERFSIVASRAA